MIYQKPTMVRIISVVQKEAPDGCSVAWGTHCYKD